MEARVGKGIRLGPNDCRPLVSAESGPELWQADVQRFLLDPNISNLRDFLAEVRPDGPDAVVMSLHDARGNEVLGRSRAASRRSVPRGELRKLETELEKLKEKAKADDVDPDMRRAAEALKLPDPVASPEFYRLYGPFWRRRLAVIWGCQPRSSRAGGVPLVRPEQLRSRFDQTPLPARRWPAAAAAVFLLLLTVGTLWWFWPRSDTEVALNTKSTSPVMQPSGAVPNAMPPGPSPATTPANPPSATNAVNNAPPVSNASPNASPATQTPSTVTGSGQSATGPSGPSANPRAPPSGTAVASADPGSPATMTPKGQPSTPSISTNGRVPPTSPSGPPYAAVSPLSGTPPPPSAGRATPEASVGSVPPTGSSTSPSPSTSPVPSPVTPVPPTTSTALAQPPPGDSPGKTAMGVDTNPSPAAPRPQGSSATAPQPGSAGRPALSLLTGRPTNPSGPPDANQPSNTPPNLLTPNTAATPDRGAPPSPVKPRTSPMSSADPAESPDRATPPAQGPTSGTTPSAGMPPLDHPADTPMPNPLTPNQLALGPIPIPPVTPGNTGGPTTGLTPTERPAPTPGEPLSSTAPGPSQVQSTAEPVIKLKAYITDERLLESGVDEVKLMVVISPLPEDAENHAKWEVLGQAPNTQVITDGLRATLRLPVRPEPYEVTFSLPGWQQPYRFRLKAGVWSVIEPASRQR
jgi:hypothetical protein